MRHHGDHIDFWVTFLEEKARVVLLIPVSDDANAYRMFETLNDRGLIVSQADLAKNYLYGRAGDRLEEAATKWSLIRGALEALSDEDALIDFLRHSLTVKNGLVREADLYKKVESTVRSPHQVMSFANDLEVLAGTYVAIQNPEHEAWERDAKTRYKQSKCCRCLISSRCDRWYSLSHRACLPESAIRLFGCW